MVAGAISSTDPPRDRPRRPRGKQVPSRYLSPSPSHSLSSTTTTSSSSSSSSSSSTILKTSKRYPSPSNPIKTPSFLPKRSQSVDRRRPSAAPVTTPATKMLITSTRSLSVSFQGESFSLPVSKTKEVSQRRSTPVRDQRENSKPVDQQRWPGASSRRGKSEPLALNPLSRSLDCVGSDRVKLGSGGFVGRSRLHCSMVDESPRVSIYGRLSLDMESRGEYLETGRRRPNNGLTSSSMIDESPKVSINGRLSLDMEGKDVYLDTGRRRPSNGLTSSVSCDFTASDTDSVSSGSTNGEISKSRSLSRNVLASARFWQETNSRLRRLQDPGSPGLKVTSVSSKLGLSKRFSSDAVPLSSPRGVASPVRGCAAIRSASPSKIWATTTTSSPARALSSPSRVRNGVSDQMNAYNRNNTPSILCFSADIRRGKIGGDRVVDAHLLRLLYNRYLQWRFVNARADSTSMVQRLNVEKNLWNAWISISELHHSVTLKRIKLLLLKQKLKLASILRGQMRYLEEWSLIDKDHSSSLSGATEALKASTLRLPIVGKTVVDIQDLKHAVSSAVDVMEAMSSSIFSLTMKVDEMNSVMVETVNVTAKEKVLLERCQGLLSRVAAMQVTDCSMKTHLIQLRPITSSFTSQQL